MQRLSVGEAICRVQQSDQDFNLKTLALAKQDKTLGEQQRRAAIEYSRKQHARKRNEIALELKASRQAEPEQEAVPETKEEKKPAKQESPPKPAAPESKPSQVALPDKQSESAQQVAHDPGRGGAQHKRWQRMIKGVGISKGWKGRIDASRPNRDGFVDVLLEKGGKKIGIEYSLTTSAKQELSNIRKCLDAGLDLVFCVFAKARTLAAVKKAVLADFSDEEREKIMLCAQEDALATLEVLLASSTESPTRSRGYVVKVEGEQAGTEGAISSLSELIRRAWKRGSAYSIWPTYK